MENDLQYEIEWNPVKISRLWNYYSLHKPYSEQYFTNIYGQSMLDKILKNVELNNLKILDFGSGPGFFFQKMIVNKINCDYYALDFSDKSISSLKNKFEKNKMFCDAITVQDLPSPYKNDFFDIVLSFEVIEHITEEQLSSMLQEVNRLLKKGGNFIITTPNKEQLELENNFCPECGCVYHKWQHITSWNQDKINVIFSKYGFKTKSIIETEFMNCSDLSLKGILKRLYSKYKGNIPPHLLYIGEKV